MILLFLLAAAPRTSATISRIDKENNWFVAGRLTGLLFQECMRAGLGRSQHHDQSLFLQMLQNCLERKTLLALDRLTELNSIVLTEGIEIVKCRKEENETVSREPDRGSRAVQSMAHHRELLQDGEMESDWGNRVFQRVAHVFSTHVLKIDMNAYGRSLQPEGRRRRRHMMASLMMFGMVAVGLIMIPMGFQFLAVLGGKALLLAKMALLLTSIQGLKKIATSNLNYGLYAAPGQAHQAYAPTGHYDRQWPFGSDTYDAGPNVQPHPPPFQYYGNIPDQQTDLMHPLQPRGDHNYQDNFGA